MLAFWSGWGETKASIPTGCFQKTGTRQGYVTGRAGAGRGREGAGGYTGPALALLSGKAPWKGVFE